MESIERNVGEITAAERQVYENVLGHKLRESQRVIISVVDSGIVATDNGAEPQPPAATSMDDWAIFADLSDEEIAEIESLILDRDRSSGREIDN